MILYVLIETLKNVKTSKVHCGIRFIVIQVNTYMLFAGWEVRIVKNCDL